MNRRPVATVRVLDLDYLIEGARRVEIDCPSSTTGMTSVPGGVLEMPVPQLVTTACYTHEERCGECDTSEAHRQGDLAAQAQVEALQEVAQAIQTRRYVEGARN
jgi:hypothetical protein